MEYEDREATLFHGTTLHSANRIVATRTFALTELFLAPECRLAVAFANRRARRDRGGTPAVVAVSLYQSDFDQWWRQSLVVRCQLNEPKNPLLHQKVEFKFAPGAVDLLNRLAFPDSWKVLLPPFV